jgi:hypothetical protein
MPGQNSWNLWRHECHHPAFMTQLVPSDPGRVRQPMAREFCPPFLGCEQGANGYLVVLHR